MFPSSIQTLINQFAKLPSVGPKTAERYVFYLLKKEDEILQVFAHALAELKEKIKLCERCNSWSEDKICSICQDKSRDQTLLAIVADSRDKEAMENTGKYNGFYFCLNGILDPLEGFKPEQLPTEKVLLKIKNEKIKEIILALDPTIEGETTAMYLVNVLSNFNNLKITRLARGLPMGATLEYADEMTIANALKYRNNLK